MEPTKLSHGPGSPCPVRAGSRQRTRVHRPAFSKRAEGFDRNARTAADHQKLAAHFRSEQARHEEERTEHEELRKEYERNSTRDPSKFPTMGDHRRSLAQSAALSAKQAQAMAAIHEELARKSN